MPWRDWTVKAEREAFVALASRPGANVSALCRRFEVSRSNGSKWLRRYRLEGLEGLAERSRRPKASPGRTLEAMEAAVLEVRAGSNEAWGARKIDVVLRRRGMTPPALSTITEILRRHGRLVARASEHPGPFIRFEKAQPNELWQMDFKGPLAMDRQRCHPLTVLDDHSRFSLGVRACGDQSDETVRSQLTAIFRAYGLPHRMLMDNGSPWGDAGDQTWTAFGVWLMRLGVKVSHGRPYHPQTQGKDERFHRTLKAEVVAGRSFPDLPQWQRAFDSWRRIYNHERPHQALKMAVPADRYRPSERPFPETLAPIVYDHGELVRRVDANGFIYFKARRWRIGKPFKHLPVALQPSGDDGVFNLRFLDHPLGRINLRTGQKEPCGLVDDAIASPTTPQAQPQPQN
jgi:transposase InsO family protein